LLQLNWEHLLVGLIEAINCYQRPNKLKSYKSLGKLGIKITIYDAPSFFMYLEFYDKSLA
jgi:hypothetical protein